MLSSSLFSNLRSFLPGKSNQPPPNQSGTAMGSGASQPIPDDLSKVKEEDDYLLVGTTSSERSEILPPQDPKDLELQQNSASCPPPPSYQDVESIERDTLPSYGSHPAAADIPFTLHPRLQVILNLETTQDAAATAISHLAPLDMDKYLYDFSLEENVNSKEGYGRGLNQY